MREETVLSLSLSLARALPLSGLAKAQLLSCGSRVLPKLHYYAVARPFRHCRNIVVPDEIQCRGMFFVNGFYKYVGARMPTLDLKLMCEYTALHINPPYGCVKRHSPPRGATLALLVVCRAQ